LCEGSEEAISFFFAPKTFASHICFQLPLLFSFFIYSITLFLSLLNGSLSLRTDSSPLTICSFFLKYISQDVGKNLHNSIVHNNSSMRAYIHMHLCRPIWAHYKEIHLRQGRTVVVMMMMTI